MKLSIYIPLILLLALSPIALLSQNTPCAARIYIPDCPDCKVDAAFILNNKDTLIYSDREPLISPELCNLRSLNIYRQSVFYTDEQGDTIFIYQDLKYSGFYSESDTLYLEFIFESIPPQDKSYISLQREMPYAMETFFNQMPGLRWESRGMEGSPFLNVRGSGLRMQYGVSNVKFYYQDMPITEADGSTPIEMLDVQNIYIRPDFYTQNYGTGNGGSFRAYLKADSLPQERVLKFGSNILLGSFGFRSYGGHFLFANKKFFVRGGFTHKESKGYRELEFLNRKNAFISAGYFINAHHSLELDALWAYNLWGLPGSVSEQDMELDRRMANPFSKNYLTRMEKNQTKFQLAHRYAKGKYSGRTGLFGGFSNSFNPYGTSIGYNGIKTDKGFTYGLKHDSRILWNLNKRAHTLQVDFLIENQQNHLHFNEKELVDSVLRSEGELITSQSIVGMGLKYTRNRWQMEGNVNITAHYFGYSNKFGTASFSFFKPLVSTHLGLQYKAGKEWIWELKGGQSISPPSWDELVNPDGSINPLRSEKRAFISLSTHWRKVDRLKIEHTLWPEIYSWHFYDFIFPYPANGIDQWVYKNSGNAWNSGLSAHYALRYQQRHPIIKKWGIDATMQYGLQYYLLSDIQVQTQQYDKIQMPGMPMHTARADLGISFYKFRLGIEGQYVSKNPLNYAHSAYQKAYFLIHAEMKFEQQLFEILQVHLFFRAQNLSSAQYSSRLQYNDSFARFYNPSPGLNFLFGLQIQSSNFLKKK